MSSICVLQVTLIFCFQTYCFSGNEHKESENKFLWKNDEILLSLRLNLAHLKS